MQPADTAPSVAELDALRRFARLVTRRLGVLGERLNHGPLTLTEARVLYEIATREMVGAAEIGEDLGLDPGYLSRILRRFAAAGWIEARAHSADRRRRVLHLTASGRAEFQRREAASRAAMAEAVRPLDAARREQLFSALALVERALAAPSTPEGEEITLADPELGDFGWIVERHAALYAAEQGWSAQFEAAVAELVAGLIRGFTPERERVWIARRRGARLGSVAVVQKADDTAQLRLLLLEPQVRGIGLGRRMVDEAIAFARTVGYRSLELSTIADLAAARALYRASGFEMYRSEPTKMYGAPMIEEHWRRPLF